jgi:NAD-dependent dihydropyrimidine dehydrogenase PreA subunit
MVMRKIIEIDEEKCDGCGNCILACAEGSLAIVDGKAKIIKDLLCDGLGACIGDCPQDALKIIEREADEFNEDAVHEHLENMKKEEKVQPQACGCAGSHMQSFASSPFQPMSNAQTGSALTHWPVQIKLVPPDAPFLKDSDLLVAADCVPIAYPSLHQEYLKDRTVMIGCPKFDNPDEYVAKFTEVFKKSGIKSVTVLLMEVPCCSGLSSIISKAMELSGQNIPVNEVVVGIKGNIVK